MLVHRATLARFYNKKWTPLIGARLKTLLMSPSILLFWPLVDWGIQFHAMMHIYKKDLMIEIQCDETGVFCTSDKEPMIK